MHESLVLPQEAKVKQLDGRLKHYSFENAEGLIQKMQQYSSLYAEENRFKKDSSPFKALLHGGVSFVKNYLLKRGFAYGADGLTISVSNAQGSYYKYVKLYERNRTITVSLIITTYNRPDALELVLKSALSQTRLPDEIIVAMMAQGRKPPKWLILSAAGQVFPLSIHGSRIGAFVPPNRATVRWRRRKVIILC